MLHRDIKPSNLLVEGRGTVWITDFGLAKSEGDADLTASDDFAGTLRYMAPERFAGWCDPRSDVYSLGVTLYELLTLSPAFDERDHSRLIQRITLEDPLPPRRLNPSIPRDLETVLLKALAKEPAQRYKSAAGLADDLRRFLADQPVAARRASPCERIWRSCRRNPAIAGLVVFAAVLLLVIAIGASAAALRLQHESRTTLAHLSRTSRPSGRPFAPSSRPRGGSMIRWWRRLGPAAGAAGRAAASKGCECWEKRRCCSTA